MYVIAVHGGCGEWNPSRKHLISIRESVKVGNRILKSNGTAVEAVEKSIRILEDSGLFNAGRGSILQWDGVARMDASIMDGKTIKAGAVVSVEGIQNNITLARLVMEKTPHVLMAREHAYQLAMRFHIKRLLQTPASVKQRWKLIRQKNVSLKKLIDELGVHDTVGAVALDKFGNLAAGVSTGGAGSMIPGRVGDCPQIGCGMYADNDFGAIATSGKGENIARTVLSRQIGFFLELKKSPKQAGILGIERLIEKTNGGAGALILTRQGQLAIVHTDSFAAGYSINGQKIVAGSKFSFIRN